MPNTKSAERRVRSNARSQLKNQIVKTQVKTCEKKFLAAVTGGNKEAATREMSRVSSAYDKAAKGGVLHRAKVNRKKSRLAVKLAAMK